MKIYPCNKFIPLLICANNGTTVFNRTEDEFYRNAINLFGENSSFDINNKDLYRITTPRSYDYIFSRYHLSDSHLLVVVCKPVPSNIYNYSIPDKSEWIVFRNSDIIDPVVGRYIKNFLGVERKQIRKVTSEQMRNMFGGEIIITMSMYNSEYQKEISNKFLSLYKESLVV